MYKIIANLVENEKEGYRVLDVNSHKYSDLNLETTVSLVKNGQIVNGELVNDNFSTSVQVTDCIDDKMPLIHLSDLHKSRNLDKMHVVGIYELNGTQIYYRLTDCQGDILLKTPSELERFKDESFSNANWVSGSLKPVKGDFFKLNLNSFLSHIAFTYGSRTVDLFTGYTLVKYNYRNLKAIFKGEELVDITIGAIPSEFLKYNSIDLDLEFHKGKLKDFAKSVNFFEPSKDKLSWVSKVTHEFDTVSSFIDDAIDESLISGFKELYTNICDSYIKDNYEVKGNVSGMIYELYKLVLSYKGSDQSLVQLANYIKLKSTLGVDVTRIGDVLRVNPSGRYALVSTTYKGITLYSVYDLVKGKFVIPFTDTILNSDNNIMYYNVEDNMDYAVISYGTDEDDVCVVNLDNGEMSDYTFSSTVLRTEGLSSEGYPMETTTFYDIVNNKRVSVTDVLTLIV